MEWRVAVEEFRNGADAVIEEFFLKTDELAFDVVHAAHLVNAQISLQIETSEPRPSRSLMVSLVAVGLSSHIHWRISAAVWRKRAHALWRHEFLRADVKHTLAFLHAERRIVERDGEKLVGTYAPVHHLAINIIEQITVFVEEHLLEGRRHLFCLVGIILCENHARLVALLFEHLLVEFHGVIPERVKLNDIS